MPIKTRIAFLFVGFVFGLIIVTLLLTEPMVIVGFLFAIALLWSLFQILEYFD